MRFGTCRQRAQSEGSLELGSIGSPQFQQRSNPLSVSSGMLIISRSLALTQCGIVRIPILESCRHRFLLRMGQVRKSPDCLGCLPVHSIGISFPVPLEYLDVAAQGAEIEHRNSSDTFPIFKLSVAHDPHCVTGFVSAVLAHWSYLGAFEKPVVLTHL